MGWKKVGAAVQPPCSPFFRNGVGGGLSYQEFPEGRGALWESPPTDPTFFLTLL